MSFDAIGLVAKKLETTTAFYQALGLKFHQVAVGHWEAKTSSGVRVMLDSVDLIRELNPNWKEPTGSSRVALCFVQESSKQVDILFNRLLEVGGKAIKAPFDAFWGQRYASVADPDGNQVDLFASLAK